MDDPGPRLVVWSAGDPLPGEGVELRQGRAAQLAAVASSLVWVVIFTDAGTRSASPSNAVVPPESAVLA